MASVGDIIHQHQGRIIELWLGEARAAASARGLSEVALENFMPAYLLAVGDALSTGDPRDTQPRERILAHLATRLRQGFELAEILAELVLLERCIAAMWSTLPLEQRPSVEDVDRLHAHFQTTTTDVSDAFRRHMLEDEQSEKRYLRLLQGIATDALHEDSAPLRERLRELLDIVMEAMGAQCAAFLAYDRSKGRFVRAAATGAGALEVYTTSLDATSFANEIAAHEQPTAVYEPTFSHFDVPESLRRAGIRSLLGVRLPPRNELVGIVFIGTADAREFTARDIGRIASLGERLAVHLDSARLFAELHEKIATLAIEKALRERFVSTLAHDLRGPLSAARLSAQLLAMEPSSLDERRDLALRIDRNIERVDRMIHNLLDANRIRAGERLPLRLDDCDLVALVQRVAEEARAMHGDRFVVNASAETILGIWSEEELRRALWNLVTNAVKYGSSDTPITIAVERRDQHVRVAVHNSGPLISVAEQANIFDPYTRGRSADAGTRTGWGLGLTLVRGVAEAHGGHVSVTSDHESGTTFIIDLPLDARLAQRHADEHIATIH